MSHNELSLKSKVGKGEIQNEFSPQQLMHQSQLRRTRLKISSERQHFKLGNQAQQALNSKRIQYLLA